METQIIPSDACNYSFTLAGYDFEITIREDHEVELVWLHNAGDFVQRWRTIIQGALSSAFGHTMIDNMNHIYQVDTDMIERTGYIEVFDRLNQESLGKAHFMFHSATRE